MPYFPVKPPDLPAPAGPETEKQPHPANGMAGWGARLLVENEAVDEVLVVDPLRALLADEDRAVEFAARARFQAAIGGDWDRLSRWAQNSWRAETRRGFGPVLAALRGLGGD